MPLQDLTPPPTPPSRNDPPEVFIERADAFVVWQAQFASEINTLATQLEATAALIAVAPAYADPGLLALAGNTPAADRLPYYDAADGSALATFTGAGRALLDDASASDQLTTLGLSANGKSLVTAADYAAMRTALSLVPGTDVQAYDEDLAAIAALTTTTFGRSLLTETDEASAFESIAVTSSSLIENNGYIVLANGLKLSWGTITIAGDSVGSWSPPVTYSSWIKPVTGNFVISGNNSQSENMGITSVSTSTISFYNADNTTLSITILAIGV